MAPMSKPEARELFLRYACNRFYMANDGADKEYKALGGGDPKEEAAWRKEYIEHWAAQISLTDLLVR